MAMAGDVTVGWDYNNVEQPSVIGFAIYIGYETGLYEYSIDVPDEYQREYTIYDLEDGRVYYMAMTAYDDNGLESAYSDELHHVANGAFNPWPPVITSPPARSIAAGDINGDGIAEIVSTRNGGLWYEDITTSRFAKISGLIPSLFAVGDINDDGFADVIGTWSNGLWCWDGGTAGWFKISGLSPSRLAVGDFTGDGVDDVVGTWTSGLWYYDTIADEWFNIKYSK
jgi:hypothetical protein